MIAAFLNGEIDVALDLVQADYDAIKGVDPAVGSRHPRAGVALRALRHEPGRSRPGQGSSGPQGPRRSPGHRPGDRQEGHVGDGVPGPSVPGQQPVHQRHPDQLLAAPGREVPAVRRRGRQRGPRRRPATRPRAPTASGSTRRRALPLVFEHCTSTAGFRELGGDFLAKAAPGDRDQAQPQLRRLDHDPVRQLAGREGRHEVQPVARQLRHVGVRLRPELRPLRRLLLQLPHGRRSRPTPTRATGTTTCA